MTENKQNNNDRTDRRPDCVTEIRMGMKRYAPPLRAKNGRWKKCLLVTVTKSTALQW